MTQSPNRPTKATPPSIASTPIFLFLLLVAGLRAAGVFPAPCLFDAHIIPVLCFDDVSQMLTLCYMSQSPWHGQSALRPGVNLPSEPSFDRLPSTSSGQTFGPCSHAPYGKWQKKRSRPLKPPWSGRDLLTKGNKIVFRRSTWCLVCEFRVGSRAVLGLVQSALFLFFRGPETHGEVDSLE